MFAWILNTKPVSFGFLGVHHALERRGAASAAANACTKALSSSRTPKLLTAEPKNTGVCWAAR